jgi:hypothetical protein
VRRVPAQLVNRIPQMPIEREHSQKKPASARRPRRKRFADTGKHTKPKHPHADFSLTSFFDLKKNVNRKKRKNMETLGVD